MATIHDLEPRVYVACLHCYNGGTLHGEWFDADDSLCDAVEKHFGANEDGRLPCGGEELMVHDHEGFGSYKLGEVSVPEAEKVAAFVVEHGIPGLLALDNFGGDFDQAAKAATESYRGAFDSLADFVEEFTTDCGDKIPEHLLPYIDWERWARDFEMGGDIWSAEEGGKVHVFWND